MTKEIRSPNDENPQLCGRRFRHSDFVIPSDFVIRHSDLRIVVCSIKRPVSGLVSAAGGGSVHGRSFIFVKIFTRQNPHPPTSNTQHPSCAGLGHRAFPGNSCWTPSARETVSRLNKRVYFVPFGAISGTPLA